MRLTSYIIKFFNQYLPHIKGCSPNTIKSYRDTISLFLPFAAGHLGIKIDSLKLDHLTTDLILDFLNQLESGRINTARTRNHRLAVLKSFAKMVRFTCPEEQKLADAILAIPQKRSQRKLIGFLYPQEVYKIFNVVKLTQKDGFRNYTLLHLLYDTGARASDRHMLKLIKQWLKVPVQTRDNNGNDRMTGGLGNKKGTPQGSLCKALHNPPYAKLTIMQSKSLKPPYSHHLPWIYFA